MTLFIEHKNHLISFILKDKKRVIGEYSFDEGGDLAEVFLSSLDNFLKKCNTNLVSVKKIELKQGENIGLTSERILRSLVRVFRFVENN